MVTLNHRLFEKAKRRLVGGVNSPVRSFNYVGGEPVLIKRGRGSKVYDYDGKAYIDYVLSWGSLILGHAYPSVIKDIKKTAEAGLGFGTTNKLEIELAEMIHGVIPFIEKIRFVNSGTEAVMGAVRLARGYTKKDMILKFEHAYHGHADYLLAKGGSGLATLKIPSSAGVPKDFVKHTLVIPFGDFSLMEKAFQKYGSRIAAVLVEPVGANYGVILPNRDFLAKLRHLTRKFGSLLIFDEIITGFRFHFGSASELFAITPDLICLGKIIGGGLPIGAYGGREKIMNHLAPLGKVYQASTFSGNPIVMQAGLSTLKALNNPKKDYEKLKDLTKYLALSLGEEARRRPIDLKVVYFATMFSLKFKEKGVFKEFYHRLLKEGVYLAPSEFEANFLSFAHTPRDVDKTVAVAKRVLNVLSWMF